MNIPAFDITFLFQLINTMLLLFILLGIPYFLFRLVYKTRKMEKRIAALEGEIERLKKVD